MKSDCGDVRVYDPDKGSLLPYWVETGTENSSSTRIWVKVPSIPGGGKKTIYLFYGNSVATSQSNGDEVFEFFDDFEGTSLDSSKWTYLSGGYYKTPFEVSDGQLVLKDTSTSGGGYPVKALIQTKDRAIIEIRLKSDGGADFWVQINTDEPMDNPGDLCLRYSDADDDRKLNVEGTNYDYYNVNEWTTLTIKYDSTKQDNNINIHDSTSNQSITLSKSVSVLDNFWLREYDYGYTGTTWVNWVFVRKFADPEPTTSVGAEQPGGDIKMKVERSW